LFGVFIKHLHSSHIVIDYLLTFRPSEDGRIQIWWLTFDLLGLVRRSGLTHWATLTNFQGDYSLSQRSEFVSARAALCSAMCIPKQSFHPKSFL